MVQAGFEPQGPDLLHTGKRCATVTLATWILFSHSARSRFLSPVK